MTRKECLEQAMGCVLRDRNNVYGKPEDCFGMIARMWGAYLGVCVSAHDVAAMMALLKIARFRHNPLHEDNAVDCAGYAACMVETATAWEREQAEEQGPQDGDEVVVFWKRKSEAEGGCCQNGNDHANPLSFEEQAKAFAKHNPPEEPKFKSGDRVQYRVELPSVSDWIWRDAMYLRPAFSWQQDGEHIVSSDDLGPVTVKDKDIRPAPKAEGVEELVQKDAPQTKEELMQRIVDCNPATFHTPSYAEEQLEHRSRLQAHKPTGEELAEMAEEEPHG